jgi:hypothetical protein
MSESIRKDDEDALKKFPDLRSGALIGRPSMQSVGVRRPKLTPQDREKLREDIVRLFEEEPEISKLEVGRRLGPQYNVSGATVVAFIRDMQ